MQYSRNKKSRSAQTAHTLAAVAQHKAMAAAQQETVAVEAAEDLLRTQLALLEIVLASAGKAKGWSSLHVICAHNHLQVMRDWARKKSPAVMLQEAEYMTACLDYADRLRHGRAEGIANHIATAQVVQELAQVNEVYAGLPASTIQDCGLAIPEFVVALEAYQCAATALVLGIDAAEVWPLPVAMWKASSSKLKEWIL